MMKSYTIFQYTFCINSLQFQDLCLLSFNRILYGLLSGARLLTGYSTYNLYCDEPCTSVSIITVFIAD